MKPINNLLNSRPVTHDMAFMDAQFILTENYLTPQHMAGLLVFTKPKKAPDDYLITLFEEMHSCPVTRAPFNYKVAKGFSVLPKWEELPPEEIDIDYHLRRSALPAPGGELELALLISRLQGNPLDMKKPLWEMHFIEGLSDNRFAIFMKLHHSLLDGMATMKIFQYWFSEDPENQKVHPFWTLSDNDKDIPAHTGDSFDGSRPTAFQQLHLKGSNAARNISQITGPLLEDMRQLIFPSDTQKRVVPYSAPASVINKRITQRRRISTASVPLKDISKLSKAMGGTFNDAIAVLVGTSIREFMNEYASLPEKSLIGGILASVRPKSDQNAKTGNAFSFLFADLATETNDIDLRMERVKESIKASKDTLFAMDADAIGLYTTSVVLPLGVSQLLGFADKLPQPLYNFGLSNLPGPRTPQYFCGSQVDALYPVTVLSQGQSLLIVVLSWVDKVNFSIISCPDVLPSSQKLVPAIESSLKALKKHAGIK